MGGAIRRGRLFGSCLAVLGLALAGCGDDDDEGTSGGGPGGEVEAPEEDTSNDDGGDSGDGGDGGDGATRDDYIEVMSGVQPGDPFTQEEAECVTGVVVDVVGLDVLNENEVLDQARDNPTGSLSDFGIELTDEQRQELGPALGDCLDVRAAMVSELSGDPSVGPEMAECLGDSVDPAVWEQLLVGGLADGEDAGAGDPSLQTAIEEAATACATAP